MFSDVLDDREILTQITQRRMGYQAIEDVPSALMTFISKTPVIPFCISFHFSIAV